MIYRLAFRAVRQADELETPNCPEPVYLIFPQANIEIVSIIYPLEPIRKREASPLSCASGTFKLLFSPC